MRFHSKLKKPVMTKRSSTSTSKASASSPCPSAIPTHDEPSGLRVLVSSPPPVADALPLLALPALSPEGQMASSISSISDFGLVTPVHTHAFDSSLQEKQVSPEDDHKDDEGGAIFISTPIPATRDMISPIPSTVPAAVAVNDELPNPHAHEPERAPDPAVNSGTSYDYDDEPSTRISAALSDGEIGIGLSLLQDFAGGGGEAMSTLR